MSEPVDIPVRRVSLWRRVGARFRNRLITGVIVALPIVATIWVITTFVGFVDNFVLRLLPGVINPNSYTPIDIPGLGLVIALIALVILGGLARNFLGSAAIRAIEKQFVRLPVVSSIYSAVKQIVDVFASKRDSAFSEVCLIQYPKNDIWAIGFVTAELRGAPAKELEKGHVCVFVPTTPNPTSGFLLFTHRREIKILDMTPEEGAKMIISGGMVSSNDDLLDVADEIPAPLGTS